MARQHGRALKLIWLIYMGVLLVCPFLEAKEDPKRRTPVTLAIPILNESEPFHDVDLYETLTPLLSDPRFVEMYQGSLRLMDLLNGCTKQCSYCYRAAPQPTARMMTQSMIRLIQDPRFQRLINPGKIRIGGAGDSADHPDVAIIAEELAKQFPDRIIDVWTHYTPRDQERIEALINIAESTAKKASGVHLVITLDKRNRRTFVKTFKDRFRFQVDGRFAGWPVESEIDDPIIFHKPQVVEGIEKVGRYLLKKPDGADNISRSSGYFNIGTAKVYLNPDGLWLDRYVTLEESPTGRALTLITPDNYAKLARTPFNPDFPTPPNWPGGKGRKRTFAEYREYEKTPYCRKWLIRVGKVKLPRSADPIH